MRRMLSLTLLACVAVLGCGNAGAPSRTSTPIGTLSPEQPPASLTGPFPTVGFAHADETLESLLPSTFNGVTLTKTSSDLSTELGADAAGRAVAAFLAGLGRSPSDLKFAQAFDPDGYAGVTIGLFRAQGVDASALRSAMVLAGLFAPKTATPPPNLPAFTTVGGKQVFAIAFPSGEVDYLYAIGDVLYDVRSRDPALAGQVLAAFP